MVSAWTDKTGLTLRQVNINEKSNEITVILQLLEMLYIKGYIFTIDAMGTQKAIAKKIKKEKNLIIYWHLKVIRVCFMNTSILFSLKP